MTNCTSPSSHRVMPNCGSARLTTLKSRIGRNARSAAPKASHRVCRACSFAGPALARRAGSSFFTSLHVDAPDTRAEHERPIDPRSGCMPVRWRSGTIQFGQRSLQKWTGRRTGRSSSRACVFRKAPFRGRAPARCDALDVFRASRDRGKDGARLFELPRRYAPTPAARQRP